MFFREQKCLILSKNMTTPILFSIVIPTYNRAHIISKTIESVLSQSYTSYEVIIVDDGSTDNTEEVVKKYLSDKVFYFKKRNEERAAARNFGTLKAKGDYINWLDSDDLIYPDNLATAVEIIHKYNGPEVFVQGFDVLDSQGKVLFSSHFPLDVKTKIYKGNPWGNSPVMVRRDIAVSNLFNDDRDLSASEDYELWLRLAAKYQIHTSDKRTVAYIYHNENSTLAMRDPDQLIKRFTKFLHYTTSNKELLTFLGTHQNFFIMKNYLLLAVDLMIGNHRKPGLRYLKKAFFISPELVFQKGFFAFIKYYFRSITIVK